ncbi:non-homologous end-joining DNA ligase LigD [Streptomyces lateritius]|uniref:non-homologous end-joining DNA ligase LigD n=1 Tax=Streptomyces lateritius TaxID=67313 RepID=UPI001679120C|nr:hypothetical protein [Streptomyces lateritius]GGT93937.1 hypothetical protein GCM10010272_43580 [Streptomyces lateritius]
MGGRTIESPSVLERHPDGIGDKGFTRKAVRDHFPDRVHRADLPEEHGVVTYAICDDTAAMVDLAGHTRVTPHRFLSQSDRRDPRTASSSTWTRRRTTSPSPGRPRRLHDLPDGFGLPSVVMITGSRGLRVLVPLDRRTPFDDVRALARPLAAPLARADADDRELTTCRPSPDAIEDLLKDDPWQDFPWRGRSHGPARRRLAAPHA